MSDEKRCYQCGRPLTARACGPTHALLKRGADSKSGEPPLCADCNHERDDSRFHFEAPGDNWGAALHHFRAKSGEPRTEPPHDPYAAYCTCSSCLDSSPDVNDPALWEEARAAALAVIGIIRPKFDRKPVFTVSDDILVEIIAAEIQKHLAAHILEQKGKV